MKSEWQSDCGRVKLINADNRVALPKTPDQSVHCVVTSPPYFGLRDYGCDGQIGLEATPDAFVAEMVNVFHECRRVLRDDGTLWLNLGDSYAGSGRGGYPGDASTLQGTTVGQDNSRVARQMQAGLHNRQVENGAIGRMWVPPPRGLKWKDLIGIPWRVAFALQADGWYLRQDIIWHKPNPMPESVRDRCTKAHEYLFLLSKSQRYWFDQEAIMEAGAESSAARLMQDVESQQGSSRVPGKTNGAMKAVRRKDIVNGSRPPESRPHSLSDFESRNGREYIKRNKRSVWTVTTKPYSEAHFATFPPDLISPCILAGCPEGGTVLDPFAGSGTTLAESFRLGRRSVGIELNAEYCKIARRRIQAELESQPLFSEIEEPENQIQMFGEEVA